MKAEKCKFQTYYSKLIAFDNHTIEKVSFKKYGKVIKIQNVWIFKDHKPNNYKYTNL